MNVLLLTIVIGATPQPSDYYRGASAAPSASDYYSGSKPAAIVTPPKEEEEDETPVINRRRVVVYVDLDDIHSLRRLVDDFDRISNIDFALKNKSEIPQQGQKFKLPLFHFSAGIGKWGFRSGWNGSDEFLAYWNGLNQDQAIQVGQSQIRVQSPQRSTSSGYRAVSYEWHLTSGESANSLRSHLSSPQPEHHGAYFNRAWLNTLTFHQLVGLHSDAHNGRVQWQYVGKQVATSTEPAAVLSPADQKKLEKQLGRVIYGTRDGKHPGPVGSSVRGWFGDPRYRSNSNSSCPNGNCPR